MTTMAGRRLFTLIAGAVAVAAAAATFTVKGDFSGSLATKSWLRDGLQLGVQGSIGAPTAPAAPNEGTAMTLPAPGSGYTPTLVSQPYDGPTEEERALLAGVRGKLAKEWHARQQQFGPDAAAMGSMPDVRLPARHLTAAELAQLRDYVARPDGPSAP